jgi:hypothetical protein
LQIPSANGQQGPTARPIRNKIIMSKTPIWLIVFERGYLYVTIGYVEHKLSFAENVHGFVFD